MSPSSRTHSPKRNDTKDAASVAAPPKQIRFVSNDGQPQTKRRRVNAACLTCRKRKTRCSGEQPVCRTCSDYNHVCLGYSEPSSQSRPQSATASRSPAPPSFSTPSNDDYSNPSASASGPPNSSGSPDPQPPTTVPSGDRDKSPKASQSQDSQGERFARDASSGAGAGAGKGSEQQQNLEDSPDSSRSTLNSGKGTHVPYFRYFGPTAIVPGFKQMVVQVRVSRRSDPASPSDPQSPPPLKSKEAYFGENPSVASGENRDTNTIPFYDRNDTLPVSRLVTHLCELFFAHLGCTFPFLQPERFLRDLKDKQVDTIVVDAVCALAARFSYHPLLSPSRNSPADGNEHPQTDSKTSDRGQPFARRAMSALVYAFSCPTMSVVQACLLLAYEEFGSNHDSGLWVYLGISIRMAQDLGMQKMRGLKYNYGRTGLTPDAVKTGYPVKLKDDHYDDPENGKVSEAILWDPDGKRAMERERVDTFWSIFFLDRVISSGTGRPVTLRDEDTELCFPLQRESRLSNGWPAPFPQLIRIIHLYGRVTDLINGIKDADHVTPDTLQRLAGMESDLTGIYQGMSPRLHFNAANFQTYVKEKEGTNFILLHFWFHTLIVLLHQPTLLNSFGGSMQQLYPNSRELSMSSAKTIADILSFAELVDGKSFIGNPFTSQPMYVAACAFIMESVYYSSPSSGGNSPPHTLLANQSSGFVLPNGQDRKSTTKHALLGSAARDNYQRCFKALKALATYWEGAKYILTVLNQKTKGIVDPLLYTVEEMESTSTAEVPPAQPFTTPGWRVAGPSQNSTADLSTSGTEESSSDPHRIDPSHAIGWSLTGAINSSQPNLSLLYQMPTVQPDAAQANPTYPSQYSHSHYLPVHTTEQQTAPFSQALEPPDHPATTQAPSAIVSGAEKYPNLAANRATTSDANLLLGLNTSYPNSDASHPTSAPRPTYSHSLDFPQAGNRTPSYKDYSMPPAVPGTHASNSQMASSQPDGNISIGSNSGGVFIGSQDVDMNTLQNQNTLPFAFNGEVLPWLEYLPEDVASFFGDHQGYSLTTHDDHHVKHSQ